jgi:hypothetical protein
MRPFLLYFVFLFSSCYGQDSAKLVKKIRAQVKDINEYSPYVVDTRDNEQLGLPATDGGLEVKYYQQAVVEGAAVHGEIRKITVWVGLSYVNNITDYYLHNNKLIFVYQKQMQFPEDSTGLRHDTTVLGFEGRYYFSEGKLLYANEKGNKRFGEEDTKVSLQKEYLKELAFYLSHKPKGNFFIKKK